MKQDKLSKWLKFIIIGVGLCGLVVYAFVVPSIGQSFSYDYPEFSGYYLPWIIFISLTSVPDRKSTRLNSSHPTTSRMPSSA